MLKVEEIIEETLDNKRHEIVEQQIKQQRKGLGKDGKPFININTGTDEYSPGYAKKKGKKKPIDLFNTGSFQREEFLDVRPNSYVIDSADEKTDKLIKQFGDTIFGLNQESIVELQPEIKPELKKVTIENLKKL